MLPTRNILCGLWLSYMVLSIALQQNTVIRCEAFSYSSVVRPQSRQDGGSQATSRRLLLRLQGASSDDDEQDASATDFFFTTQQDYGYGEFFEDAEILDLSLTKHRPLGCTVEESMGKSGKYVFISKVKEGGNAQKGGLRVGDVIVACSDVFGSDLMPIVESSDTGANDDESTSNESMMDTVLDLIGARPDSESLELRVARGTSAMLEHESALVELCSNPGASQTEIEDCMMDFLKESYTLPEVGMMDAEEQEECNPDEDDDCLLDSAFDLWNQEMDYATPKPAKDDGDDSEKTKKKPKAKPWSSRSSPSGTFVRDPKTGKLINIDA